ncbi:MAG: peptidylprolyl isomerase [Ginsengibacter sp.]
MMKIITTVFLLVCFSHIVSGQVLFTYGKYTVDTSEFLRAYNKNKGTDSAKDALDQYLDLYIKFKLKVQAAKDLHLDTLASLQNDLASFRTQIEESYLSDETEMNNLVTEAFTRSQKDIHAVYLFIPEAKSTKAADTIALNQKVKAAYNDLAEKHFSFADVTESLKKKSVGATWADVGFITVFSIPYELENIVYKLSAGEISKPYRSKKGFYIFQNIEERQGAGTMKAAQILIATPLNAGTSEKNAASKKIDSIYNALLKGADFAQMAAMFSNDKLTFVNGGVLPDFGTGRYDPVFENKAFGLKKNGDFTSPFQTAYGFHIVKRINIIPVSANGDDAITVHDLKEKIQQDSRVEIARAKFLKGVLKQLGYKKNLTINVSQLSRVTDSFTMLEKKDFTKTLNDKTVLHSFKNGNVTVGDWLSFANSYKSNADLYKDETNAELLEKYIGITAIEKYKALLENYNPAFKFQLQEFKDGNMLFEAMERNVWGKASEDSVGLEAYYDKNKLKYKWTESADAILLACASRKVALDATDALKKGQSTQQITSDFNMQLQADSGRFELSQLPLAITGKHSPGYISSPSINEDSTATVVKIIKLYPAGEQRQFNDAKGMVISDYQNLLEDRWIEELKKKYPVKVNQQVFNTLR